MSNLLPHDLQPDDGHLLARVYRKEPNDGILPSDTPQSRIGRLERQGFVKRWADRWVLTAEGNAAGLLVIQEWYGETR